jgi:succinate-acetate transporter protein
MAESREDGLIGDPVPLGLVAFGTSAFAAGTVLAGWWPNPARDLMLILPTLIIFGGIAQFVTAMWSYARGHTLAATFLGAFGSLFALSAIVDLALVVPGRIAIGAGRASVGPLGVVAGCFAFIALFVALGMWRRSLGFALTSLALTISLGFFTWSLFAQGNVLLAEIGGWVALISGFLGLITGAVNGLGFGLGVDHPVTLRLPGLHRAA